MADQKVLNLKFSAKDICSLLSIAPATLRRWHLDNGLLTGEEISSGGRTSSGWRVYDFFDLVGIKVFSELNIAGVNNNLTASILNSFYLEDVERRAWTNRFEDPDLFIFIQIREGPGNQDEKIIPIGNPFLTKKKLVGELDSLSRAMIIRPATYAAQLNHRLLSKIQIREGR